MIWLEKEKKSVYEPSIDSNIKKNINEDQTHNKKMF